MMGLGELLVCAGAFLLVTFGAAVWFILRRRLAPPPRPRMSPAAAPPIPHAPRSRDVIFFLRFEGRDDEDYVRDIVARHATLRTAADAREAALALVRAAPTATHVFVGPGSDAPAGPTLARTGLPGGVVVGFLVHSTQPMDTVADDQDLGKVVAELRRVAAFTDAQFAGAQLALAATSVDAQAPALVAVRKETRPGHRLCAYCGQPHPAHELRCPNCGAQAAP